MDYSFPLYLRKLTLIVEVLKREQFTIFAVFNPEIESKLMKVTTFHRLLAKEMPNCDLKSVRNLQIAIKKLNDSTNKGKIKDCGIERTYINEWRSYLTKAD